MESEKIVKDFGSCFDMINDINNATSILVQNHDVIPEMCYFSKGKRYFELGFLRKGDIHYPRESYPYCFGPFEFETERCSYYVPEKGSVASTINEHVNFSTDFKIKLESFWTKELDCKNGDYHWVYMTPWTDDVNINFYDYECSVCYIGKTFDYILRLKFEEGEVHVGKVVKDKKQYLFIDLLFSSLYKEASYKCRAILVALGLLSGNLFFDESYMIAFKSKDYAVLAGMRYQKLVESFQYSYPLFTTNMYSVMCPLYLQLYGKEGEQRAISEIDALRKENKDIKPIPTVVIKNIVSNFLQREPLLRSAYMLMVSCNTTLEMQPPVGAVVLETISTELLKDVDVTLENDAVAPDKWASIHEHLNGLIDQELSDGNLTAEGAMIFKNRINGLGGISNRKKLSLPFKLLGYRLSKAEKSIIDYRNSFLHGNLSTDMLTINTAFGDLQYYTTMLHRLCAILLLRYASFEGHIINYSLLHKPSIGESGFIKIG